jgi:hypothetical protein
MSAINKIIFFFSIWIICSCKQPNNSPCLIQATYDRCGFVFREDGTYGWVNGSGMGVFTQEGTYKINKNHILLDTSNVDNVVTTKYLLITHKLPWWNDTTNTFVIQVNDRDEMVDSHFVFKIYIDNRKAL